MITKKSGYAHSIKEQTYPDGGLMIIGASFLADPSFQTHHKAMWPQIDFHQSISMIGSFNNLNTSVQCHSQQITRPIIR
jgi:hypothetical protein